MDIEKIEVLTTKSRSSHLKKPFTCFQDCEDFTSLLGSKSEMGRDQKLEKCEGGVYGFETRVKTLNDQKVR